MAKIKIARLRQLLAFVAAYPILLTAAAPTALAVGTGGDPNCKNTTASNAAINKCVSNNQIVKDLQSIVDALSAGVAIIIVIMIIIGGIQYMAAGDSAEQVGKAKRRITNALIALAAFLFIDAFVQWLVPGGIFG